MQRRSPLFTRIVASARRSVKSLQTVRCIPSGDSDEEYGPGKQRSGSIVPRRGPKSRTPGKATKKQGREVPGKDHNGGQLSMLSDVPFDVLYDVSCRTISMGTAGGMR